MTKLVHQICRLILLCNTLIVHSLLYHIILLYLIFVPKWHVSIIIKYYAISLVPKLCLRLLIALSFSAG